MVDAPSVPAHFYQFWPLNSDSRWSWLEELVRNSRIYFRARASLNDPLELRPRVVMDGPEKEVRAYAKDIINRYSKLPPGKRIIAIEQMTRRLMSGTESLERALHELTERIGVLSLSATASSGLLWAHYADGYRGVAVEFRSDEGLFLTALPVHYVTESPVINRLQDDRETIFAKTFFTKGSQWAYEEEWRVIARWDDHDRIERYIQQHGASAPVEAFMRAQHGPGYYELPPGAISSIVFGPSMPQDDVQRLEALTAGREPVIPLRRSAVAPDGSVAINAR